MLTENHIIDLLEIHFKEKDCIIKKANTNQRGIDMIVEQPDGQILNIEIKGETSSKEYTRRYNQPFTKTQIWNHVSVALMKTLVDMAKPENVNAKFAMAFPRNHKKLLEGIKPSLEKLDITVYFVSGEDISTL